MEPNIDIVKDFAKLQVTIRELTQSNMDLIAENMQLKEENKELQKIILRLKAQRDW